MVISITMERELELKLADVGRARGVSEVLFRGPSGRRQKNIPTDENYKIAKTFKL